MKKGLWGMLLLLSAASFYGCQKSANGIATGEAENKDQNKYYAPFVPDEEWNKYWYGGKAELTSYSLEQSRYGELHEGTVVNVFVTEDFSRSQQVKFDDPSAASPENKVSVLKLNQSLKFNTGIYPYSIMLSSFVPVDVNSDPHALKITASIQEWCGNVFIQLNNRDENYEIEQRSYFEKEGDRDIKISQVILEDELWNLIRISPEKLPTGEQTVFPGTIYLRLSHKPLESVQAKLTKTEKTNEFIYSIEYPSLKRVLNIHFEKTFPYRILGWDDTYHGFDGLSLTTTAARKKEFITDYWSKHSNADLYLRDSLGLPEKWQ